VRQMVSQTVNRLAMGRLILALPCTAGADQANNHTLTGRKTMSRGIMHWEGRDLMIPLAISMRHWYTPDYVGAAAPRAQQIIETYLHNAARDGWQADEATDFAILFSRSHVRTRNNLFRWRVDSATIRLLRAVRNA
jgi:hypothetical protein